VAGIGSGASLLAAGCVASCGVLLAVAGASKLYRAARQLPGDSAIRGALRMTRHRWRRAEPAAGAVECAVGAIVCSGAYPAAGGAALAALGAAFCALLGYARARRMPGGCGCIDWGTRPRPAAEAISGREITRAVVLAGAGVAGAVFLRGEAGAFGRPWFWAGVLAGGAVLAGLSVRAVPGTPACGRAWWFPARATLRALAGHGVFAAMAEAAGPFGPVVRYRRAGCAEELWFTPLGESGQARAVVFQVRHAGYRGALAVHASVRDVTAAGEAPARVISTGNGILAPARMSLIPTTTHGLSS
jgi:hypothetical protein